MNTENPDYVDPRGTDPLFPSRPTHPDFVRLSEIVQEHDHRTEHNDENPFDVLGVDEESFMYFLRNRLTILGVKMGLASAAANPILLSLYLDAFALGKAYATESGELTVYISREGVEVSQVADLVDGSEETLDWLGIRNGRDVPITVRLSEADEEGR